MNDKIASGAVSFLLGHPAVLVIVAGTALVFLIRAALRLTVAIRDKSAAGSERRKLLDALVVLENDALDVVQGLERSVRPALATDASGHLTPESRQKIQDIAIQAIKDQAPRTVDEIARTQGVTDEAMRAALTEVVTKAVDKMRSTHP